MDGDTKSFLEEFEKRITERLDGIEGRLGKVEGRLGKVEGRLEDIEEALDIASEERELIWDLIHRRLRRKKSRRPLAETARESLSRKVETMRGDNLADIFPMAAKKLGS